MSEDRVKLKYIFTTPAKIYGSIEIPREMFDRVSEDDSWSTEIENYILERHDYLYKPPEIEPEDGVEFDDICKTHSDT